MGGGEGRGRDVLVSTSDEDGVEIGSFKTAAEEKGNWSVHRTKQKQPECKSETKRREKKKTRKRSNGPETDERLLNGFTRVDLTPNTVLTMIRRALRCRDLGLSG